jgi:hypothetical protein
VGEMLRKDSADWARGKYIETERFQTCSARDKIFIPSSTLHNRSASVFSPIGFQEFDAQKYREFVRTLSDEALIKEGKQVRWLSGDGKIVSTTVSVFDKKLEICRKEYRRRHSIPER